MPEMNVEKKRTERPGADESLSRTRRGEFPTFWSNPWSLMSMNPFALMRQFSEEFDRSFGSSFRGDAGLWSPAVDVAEKDGGIIVRADLPGLSQDDVKIEVTPEGLVIQGERKREHEVKGSWGYRTERTYGSFYRTVPLPDGARIDEAKAQFNNGVLEISVPLDQQYQKRRQIPITGAFGDRKPAASENAGQKQEARAR